MSDYDDKKNPHREDDYETKELVHELAADYGQYFSIDNSREISQFEDAVEQTLTHLEEFCGALDVLRSEEMDKVDQISSIVASKLGQLDFVYKEIDKLEAFVKIVKAQVESMEEEFNKAEKLFSSSNRVKKFFVSLLPNKKVPSQNAPARPKLLEVFKTENYLGPNKCSEDSSDDLRESSDMDRESS